MIGTQTNAQIAQNIYENVSRNPNFPLIGKGCYRNAYKGPDGVVYKAGDTDCNRTEGRKSRQYRRNRYLRELGFVVPDVTLHRVSSSLCYHQTHTYVVAMAFVPGEQTFQCATQFHDCKTHGKFHSHDDCECVGKCIVALSERFEEVTGVGDLHDENVLRYNDKWHVIDMGCD